jgi:hypothetical protein
MTIAITHAKTGRSMKKRDIDTSAFRLQLLRWQLGTDRANPNPRAQV